VLLRIDHLVVAVRDPEAAAAELTRTVGLTVSGGGRHPMWGTYNRLAWLGDTYVELIGIFDRSLTAAGAVSRAVREALDAGRPGLVSFAIATDDIDARVARLRAAGSALGEPETRSRTRPDGEVVTWRAAYGELGPAAPPFLIEHEMTGAEWGDEARAARATVSHPLGGPVQLIGLELPVPDIHTTSAAYAEMVGLRVDPTSLIAHVGDQSIHLVRGRPLVEPAVVELEIEGETTRGPRPARRAVEAVGLRWRITG
jgi:catechol 2,3-dioxygenase-like lactoylglutathione lyase family enzyme